MSYIVQLWQGQDMRLIQYFIAVLIAIQFLPCGSDCCFATDTFSLTQSLPVEACLADRQPQT